MDVQRVMRQAHTGFYRYDMQPFDSRVRSNGLLSGLLICILVVCAFSSVYAETYIPAMTITQNIVLGPNAAPNPYGIDPDTTYIVTGDIIVRHSNSTDIWQYPKQYATLTIEAGVTLRFEPGAGLQIGWDVPRSTWDYWGLLYINGTATDPVILTANAATPGDAPWDGVTFTGASGGRLTHARLAYGGGGSTHNANLYAAGASLTVEESQFLNSHGVGIYLTECGGTYRHNRIEENQSTGLVLAYNVSSTIDTNEVLGNSGHGITVGDKVTASVIDNTIAGNTGDALRVNPGAVSGIGNNFGHGNGTDQITIEGGEILNEDAIWHALALSALPYVVTGDIVVRSGNSSDIWQSPKSYATLTIEAGVTLRFEPGAGLQIGWDVPRSTWDYWGLLYINGTVTAPVILTSNAAVPGDAPWDGIMFTGASGGRLTHAQLRYGGGGSAHNANLYVTGASLTVEESQFLNSTGVGIYVTGGGGTYTHNQIMNNHSAGLVLTGNASPAMMYNRVEDNQGTGLILDGDASSVIDTNEIVGNSGHGITMGSNVTASVLTNTITGNTGDALRVHPNAVSGIGNNFGTGNGTDRVTIEGGEILNENAVWHALTPSALPYVVTGDIIVRHVNSSYAWDAKQYATLTIEAGVTLRFEPGTGLQVGWDVPNSGYDYWGRLYVNGTDAAPVILTANAAVPEDAPWDGVMFTGASGGHLTHARLAYGGGGSAHNANLYVTGASLTVEESQFLNSYGVGVYLTGCGGTYRHNRIEGNPSTGLVLAYNVSSTIDTNEIRGNPGHGMTVGSNVTASVINNTIAGNSGDALRVHPSSVSGIGNNFGTGNGTDRVTIEGGEILNENAVWHALTPSALPYVVTGDIIVRHVNSSYAWDAKQYATLTIEAGVTLRFEPGTGLQVGWDVPNSGYDYWGRLYVNGTDAAPVILTANAAVPEDAPWDGVMFTGASGGHLTHARLAYGGGGSAHNANLYLNYAPVMVEYCEFLDSHGIGLRIDGVGSAARYSMFQGNTYGVYVSGNAQPTINYNNFLGNPYSVYNASSVVVNAEHNYWGANNGPYDPVDDTASGRWYHPDGNGEQVSDYVDYDPYETQEVTNSLPTMPTTPIPANNAVNVALDAGTTTLQWTGGDPDIWDSVTYEVRFGAAPDALTVAGTTNPDDASFVKDALERGTTYYWQIVARDQAGAQTVGPIWHFTTQGDPADLVVTSMSLAPTGNLDVDQTVTFTAIIENIGAGPVVDAFTVDVRMDGSSIGTQQIEPILYPGDTATVMHTWKATAGTHTITIVADSANSVDEDVNEDNNEASQIFDVLDVLPPVIVSTVPQSGASLQTLNQVVVTLADQHGTVDDAAVRASFTVQNNAGQTISGTVTEVNDVFTFAPDGGVFGDALYTVSFTAVDQAVPAPNSQTHSFTFTVDAAPPIAPTITGGTVSPGGQIKTGQDNLSTSTTVILTGTRDDETSVWIDGVQKVAVGSGNWSAQVSLDQSLNELAVGLRDRAGNPGPTVTVRLVVDSVAPAVTAITPANNSFLTVAPEYVIVAYQETGSGVNWPASLTRVLDANLTAVAGDWDTVSAADQAVFTPLQPFGQGAYTVEARLEDGFGNRVSMVTTHFTVVGARPNAPAITGGSYADCPAAVSAAHCVAAATVTLTGTRADNTSVWINSVQAAPVGSGNWSANVTLQQGLNSLTLMLRDQAGQESDAIAFEVFADSVAPAISAISPEANSFVNPAPAAVVIEFVEETSDLNFANSVYALKDGGMTAVPGSWADNGQQLTFTPDTPLIDDAYTLFLQLTDVLGNAAPAAQRRFTVDTTPPAPPAISVSSLVENPRQSVSGSKEAYAAILLQGQTEPIIAHTLSTSWVYPVTLNPGQNVYTFVARDRAGNESEPVSVAITFDDTLPLPVTTLNAQSGSDGASAILTWTYDETLHGDIQRYRIYAQETAPGTDPAAITVADLVIPTAEVEAGTFTVTLTGLVKGATYWFTVEPVDAVSQQIPDAVSAAVLSLEDTIAPHEVTNVQTQSFDDRLVITWTAPSDPDLAGYRVYFNNDQTGEDVAVGTQNYEKTGLTPATAYPIRIVSVDDSGNASAGATITAVTLLANPSGLNIKAYSGYATLSWKAAEPQAYVRHYTVYVSETDFTDVAGLTPRLTTTDTTIGVSGLVNGTTYYVAVTTINTSGGERTAVSTAIAVPAPDTQGPEFTSVKANDVTLTQGHSITEPVKFTVTATDPGKVNRVEFRIDGAPLRTDYNGSPAYFAYWNVVNAVDGAHTLTLTAYDTLGNSSTRDYSLLAALAPPPAPAITAPVDGLVTNTANVTVSGTAVPYAEVLLWHNGVRVGNAVSVESNGKFSLPLTLTEGANDIQVQARYRGDGGPTGALSAARVVTLDTTLPSPPANVSASAKKGGEIGVNWQAPAMTGEARGYNLYRSAAAFTRIADAVLVNSSAPLTGTSYTDLPPADGEYYYGLTTVDLAGNESDLSAVARVTSDRTGPKAAQLSVSTTGLSNAGRLAPGTLTFLLTVNEPLQFTPFLSIAPEQGVPYTIALTSLTALTYKGAYTITAQTPSGPAYMVFSARDAVGNRGTEFENPAEQLLNIDTDGPAVARLLVQPAAPLRNSTAAPQSVTVTLGLDEAAADAPQLAYELLGRSPIDLPVVTEVVPAEGGDAQTWRATFTLPANAGADAPEQMRFVYQGRDDLQNVSDRILAENLFEVYQGALPAPNVPSGLRAEARPGGVVSAHWNAVDGAAGYRLYRQAPGESALTLYIPKTAEFMTDLEYTDGGDTPLTDGTYTYAVSSMRAAPNGDMAESALSALVTAAADSTPPAAPQNLAILPVSEGMYITWEDPQNAEPVRYNLYRASGTSIPSVSGLTPAIADIPASYKNSGFVDTNPSVAAPCYVMTAVDAVGNESAPSNSAYHTVELLPVSNLRVRQQDAQAPVVSWQHASAAGYDIFLERAGQSLPLNAAPLTAPTYTDNGYTGSDRRYAIAALNAQGAQSLKRSIDFPTLRATLQPGARLKRGLMNRITYTVKNLSSARVEQIHLNVLVAARQHASETFGLDAGEQRDVSVVIGGYQDLLAVQPLTTTIVIAPNSTDTIEIVRAGEIEVVEGRLIATVLNEEFTRGITGSTWFTLENTGDEVIEVVTSSNNGASGDIGFTLVDADGNVLSAASFTQTQGPGFQKRANGTTVALIPAHGSITFNPVTLTVPSNAPDTVIARVTIKNLYAQYGLSNQVTMNGLSAGHAIALVDTDYYGTVTVIAPQRSDGDEDIHITAQAVERATGQPMPGVPLKLTVTSRGFDRTYDLLTGADGTFTYAFTPLSGESGLYAVRAMPPSLRDRPVHGQFVISRVDVSPVDINVQIPRNYTQSLSVDVITGAGTLLRNVQLNLRDALPDGVSLILGTPQFPSWEGPGVGLVPSASSVALPMTLRADTGTVDNVTIVLDAVGEECVDNASPEGGSECQTWQSKTFDTVTINAAFSEALPVLNWSPDYVETGMAHGDTSAATVTLKNTGLGPLEAMRLSLLNDAGNAPAPGWVTLLSSAAPDDLAVGAQHQAAVRFAPDASVAEGWHTALLRVASANHPTIDVQLHVMVTQAGQGNVVFRVSDIYTFSKDAQGNLIEGLHGAQIRVQHEDLLSLQYTQTTNSVGETEFVDLPVGRYRYRISAPNHQDASGAFWVKPGITAAQDVFLEYNLVTVEWDVWEITIEDRYELQLKTTFTTDVPAAVVVAEPASVTLPEMLPGDVYYGQFTLVNYGLIRADHIAITVPQTTDGFSYEILQGIPDSLEAKARITIPYRVTRLEAAQPDSGDSSGGGTIIQCNTVPVLFWIEYSYECSNGHVSETVTQYYINTLMCTEVNVNDGSVKESYDEWYRRTTQQLQRSSSVSTGGVTQTRSRVAPKSDPNQLPGADQLCYPTCPGGECDNSTECATCGKKETCQRCEQVNSSVNTVLREYRAAAPGLSVDVPGGLLRVEPQYWGGEWRFSPDGSGFDGLPTLAGALQFHQYGDAERGYVISSIIKDGNIAYDLPPENFALRTDSTGNKQYVYTGEQVYIHDTSYTITPYNGGWRWREKSGDWKQYGPTGRLIALGDRHGVTATVLFDDDGSVTGTAGKVIGYADRNGAQVVWIDYNPDGRIAALRDAGGRQVTYTYVETHGRASLQTVTDVNGDDTVYLYDSEGRLSDVTKPGGVESHLTYNSTTGDIETVTDENGAKHQFAYSYDKHKKAYYAMIIKPDNRVKEVWYDEHGNTTRVDLDGVTAQTIQQDGTALLITDADGNATRKEYDAWNNLTRVVYPDGTESAYEYEHTYQQLTRKTERGLTTEYTYTADGALQKLVEAKGTPQERITEYVFDTDGNRIQMRLTENAGTAQALTTIEDYDSDGNRAKLTEATGTAFERVTDYTYTGGRLTTITKHLDVGATAVTEMDYDDDGNLIWQKDPSGQETTYTYVETPSGASLQTVTTPQGDWKYGYDPDGQLSSVTDPFGRVRSREYDADGNVKTVLVDGKTVATYTYTDGQLTQRTDAAGQATTFAYTNGQLTRQEDPAGAFSEYVYDEQGRLWKTLDANGNTIERVYGAASGSAGAGSCTSCGLRTSSSASSEIERLLHIVYPTFTKAFTYDDEGRVIEETYTFSTDARPSVSTTYTYDAQGRLHATTGPDGQTTTYGYDLMGRRTSVTDASGITQFEYDRWDNLVALTDANNQRTEFDYYPDGKLWKERRPMGEETVYEYYPSTGSGQAGRLWKVTDPKQQTTEYEYDSQSRVWKIHYADGRSVTLSYDADGNLGSYDDGVTSASYTYDSMGRKLTESVNYGSFTKAFEYTYYANGLKKTFTAPGGTVYTYTYSQNNELRDVQIPGVGSISIPEYNWTRPATMVYPGGSRRDMTYDSLMRIVSLTAKDPGGNALLDYAYTYDDVGNIKTKNTGHGNYTYGYDTASRLTSADNPVLADDAYAYDNVGNRTSASNAAGSITHNLNNELLTYGDIVYEYDDNGNMTRKGVGTAAVNYIYNAANRLIRVEDELTHIVIVEYYYDPFGRRLWKEVSGVRTYFFYSEEGLIAEYDGTGAEIRSYGYKPDSTWTTDPLWLKQGGAYYWYQNDHLGTPQKLTDSSGQVVWSAQYAAFGEAVIEVETVTNNLRFPGQYYDVETGLHYNRYRYYESESGRYLRTDPNGLRGGFNLFAYTFNNPGKMADPMGLGIHPQYVISPDEAYDLVFQYAMRYSGARELVRELGDTVVKPGPRNRFVFTCKYGWIDMGHFFNGAEWGYKVETTPSIFSIAHDIPDSLLAHGSELYQLLASIIKNRPRTQPSLESVYTVEDLLSNELGITFGRELAQEEPSYLEIVGNAFDPTLPNAFDPTRPVAPLHSVAVSSKWLEFLIESGAVHYDMTKDKDVYEDLRKDAHMYWDTGCNEVTTTALDQLRNEGVPDSVLSSLTIFVDGGEICDEEKFRRILLVTIGSENTALYEELIIQYTYKDHTYPLNLVITDGEFSEAVYNDIYRQPWDEVKCESPAYQKYCCCPESTSDFDCQNNCRTGKCQEKPIQSVYWYPPEN